MQVYNILSQQYHSPVVPTSSSNMSTSMGTCFKHPSSKTWRMPCLNINLDISGFPDHIQSVGIHFAQGCIAAQQKALLNSTGSQHAPFRFMTWGANILNNRLSLFVVHEKDKHLLFQGNITIVDPQPVPWGYANIYIYIYNKHKGSYSVNIYYVCNKLETQS